MKKVSVVMGVYNVMDKRQLVVSLESIVKQTYKEIELIICDDGSNPECFKNLREVINEIETKYNRQIIFLQNETNLGLARALNKCIKKSTGDYIARMDADDISMPERIEKQVDFLEQNKDYDFVGTSIELIDENDKVLGERIYFDVKEKEDFLKTSPYVHPSVMYRKEIFDECGLYSEDEKVKRVEDYELFMRFFASGKRGYNMPEKLVCFRETYESYKRKKYRYRINEMHVRKKGFEKLGIKKKKNLYIIKPIIVGMIPGRIMMNFKVRRDRVKEDR